MRISCFKSLLTLSITLLSFTIVHPQTGTVHYKNEATLSHYMLKKKKNAPVLFQRLKDAAELTAKYNSKISYALNFRDSIAVFKVDPLTQTQKEDRLLRIIKNKKHDYYYCEPKNTRFFRLQDRLVKNTKIKWEIGDESKIIQGYTCKKAITKLTFYEGREAKPYLSKVIAWFAPKLPYAFGPKGYGGLPGLILELKEPENTFIAENITIPDPAVNLNWPKDTPIITLKELIEKAQKNYQRKKSKF